MLLPVLVIVGKCMFIIIFNALPSIVFPLDSTNNINSNIRIIIDSYISISTGWKSYHQRISTTILFIVVECIYYGPSPSYTLVNICTIVYTEDKTASSNDDLFAIIRYQNPSFTKYCSPVITVLSCCRQCRC